MAWNRQLKKRIGVGPWDNGYDDNRIFNNGPSDVAGAGANVGMAAAVAGVGNTSQMNILDQYLTETVYGVKKGLPFGASLQCVEGQEGQESPSCRLPSVVGPTADGVMASMFWVPPNAPGKMLATTTTTTGSAQTPGTTRPRSSAQRAGQRSGGWTGGTSLAAHRSGAPTTTRTCRAAGSRRTRPRATTLCS